MADIKVRVTPKSSRNAVILEGDLIRIYTTAPPADNEANKSVLELLAKALKTPKSRLEITRGHSSREKTISIPDLTPEEIRSRLQTL
jgi:uncharacterized protein (TIGR00251 family)